MSCVLCVSCIFILCRLLLNFTVEGNVFNVLRKRKRAIARLVSCMRVVRDFCTKNFSSKGFRLQQGLDNEGDGLACHRVVTLEIASNFHRNQAKNRSESRTSCLAAVCVDAREKN